MGQVEVSLGVELSPPDTPSMGKQKGMELMVGTSKRIRRKAGETSSSTVFELWKPELSTCELGRQVKVADSAQDHDTSMALALVVLLVNDVAALTKEALDTFEDLLMMQQVQVGVVTSVRFKLHI